MEPVLQRLRTGLSHSGLLRGLASTVQQGVGWNPTFLTTAKEDGTTQQQADKQLGTALQTTWTRPTNSLLAGLSRFPFFKTFASSGIQQPPQNILTAAEVLQQTQVLQLRQELKLESEQSLHIPMSRFVELALTSGAATSEAEAKELCTCFHKSGIVLRHMDTVYLRPEEVAEMVMQVLPGGREDAERKLKKVEEELAELDKVHTQLETSSHRLANLLLTGGLMVLTAQFAAFIYLTWWELSWDVMEPIAYIISLFYSILAYCYFLSTRNTFDLEPFREFWARRFKDKKLAAVKFDAERYAYLMKLKQRYQKHLAHVRVRP